MKKLFALLLALVMVLSLAACGGGDEKTPSNDDKTPGSIGQQEQNSPDPDEGEDEPDNQNTETYEWPTDEWIIDAMMYTGAGEIVSIQRNDTETKKEIKLHIDGSNFADAAAYYDKVVAGGMDTNYGEEKPDSDESFYPILYDLENGYQVEFNYIKDGSTVNYGKSTYNLMITLRKLES